MGGAATRNFADVFSPVQVEALAIRVGLELVVERGIHNVVFESDSLRLILALNVSSVNLSHVGPIIEDAKSLLLLITGAMASHIHRQGNYVAHRLARFAIHSDGECTWFVHPPIILYDLLEEDCLHCNC
ncbi:hypothetical protein D8674_026895 [Pyrus ussuriensis x Pyrus communis]|uniref:RNase H type-1 domain-containing protein n=1 Tax=Pyrus ussuriensis x Pyrus communis TaxID=2448454 RepID=A0A5N5ICP5_9ROSA|nr:hypothetical protein D8674_026895 [Pyrus ussuriensis x Pyrus communis]